LTLAQFAAWFEGSLLGHAMRDSGVWTYGVVNLAHILGVALLFGSIAVLDLRLIGVWRQVPLAALSKPIVPMATIGFLLASITGIGLLATKTTDYLGNPFLYAKFPIIGLALVNVHLLHRSSAWKAHKLRDLSDVEKSQLARMGGASLVFWTGAISAGRMIGYW
jgi:hypothetical protein